MVKKVILLVCIVVGFGFISCAEPSPLVGKWSDNYDFLTLMPDMGFTFSIKDKASGEITRLEGT
ncbi:MAG: hypothetical protein ACRC4W_06495, partial [Treponemataceae bacterium]